MDIFKKDITKDLKASNQIIFLWYYCAERQYKIIHATAHGKVLLNSQTPQTLITVQPTDISDIYRFGW